MAIVPVIQPSQTFTVLAKGLLKLAPHPKGLLCTKFSPRLCCTKKLKVEKLLQKEKRCLSLIFHVAQHDRYFQRKCATQCNPSVANIMDRSTQQTLLYTSSLIQTADGVLTLRRNFYRRTKYDSAV